MVRISRSWPLPVAGGAEVRNTIPLCPGCGSLEVDVCHALRDCHATKHYFEDLCYVVPMPSRSSSSFLVVLFAGLPSHGHRLYHIRFVGQCLLLSSVSYGQ